MTTIFPTQSSALAEPYTVKSLDRKVKNKAAFQKELGWAAEPKRPMLCFPAGMSDALGGEVFEELLPGILSLPIEVVVLGKGSKKYGELFTQLASKHKHRIAIIEDGDSDLKKRMYAAADMALFLADPTGQKELKTCLQYGVVPVAPRSKGLEPYDPVQESGCTFDFDKMDVWRSYAAIVRALETYKFPFDWRTIQQHCMESVSVD